MVGLYGKKEQKNLNTQVSDDQLEGVQGGYIFMPYGGKWEVINNVTGNVLASFPTKKDAEMYAKNSILASTKEVTWETIESKRKWFGWLGGPSVWFRK